MPPNPYRVELKLRLCLSDSHNWQFVKLCYRLINSYLFAFTPTALLNPSQKVCAVEI